MNRASKMLNIGSMTAILFGLLVAISLLVTEWSEHSALENGLAIGIIGFIIILTVVAACYKPKGKAERNG